jgi:uncharacterized RDD family membrane protein YckC
MRNRCPCPFCKELIIKEATKCRFCGEWLNKIATNESNEIMNSFDVDVEGLSEFNNIAMDATGIKNSETQQTTQYEYGGFYIRFGAFLIDWLIIILLYFGFTILIARIGNTFDEEIFKIIAYPFFFFYHIFFLSIISSTPGKLLFGLEVVDRSTFERISISKSFLRSLGYIVSLFSNSNGLFSNGFLSIRSDIKCRGVHDNIANTYVIKKRKYCKFIAIPLSIISGLILGWFFGAATLKVIMRWFSYL